MSKDSSTHIHRFRLTPGKCFWAHGRLTTEVPWGNEVEIRFMAKWMVVVEKAGERAPALVILDLSIPMDGVETASALRETVPGAKINGLAMFAGQFPKSQLAAAGD